MCLVRPSSAETWAPRGKLGYEWDGDEKRLVLPRSCDVSYRIQDSGTTQTVRRWNVASHNMDERGRISVMLIVDALINGDRNHRILTPLIPPILYSPHISSEYAAFLHGVSLLSTRSIHQKSHSTAAKGPSSQSLMRIHFNPLAGGSRSGSLCQPFPRVETKSGSA